MISATSQDPDGTPLFLLGLTRKELVALSLGHRVQMPVGALPSFPLNLSRTVVFAGEDEETIMGWFSQAGLIGDGTVIQDPDQIMTDGGVPDTVEEMLRDAPRRPD